MKTKYYFILALLIPFSFGCKKFSDKTEFDMDFSESITVQSSSGLNLPFNIFSPDVETNSESTFAVNNTRKDLIEEIFLNSVELKLTSPSNSDFSFLKSISVFLSADGLGETKIAWMKDIPNNIGNSILLNITEADLKEFIKKDAFDLRVNTVTDEVLTTDHTIDVLSSFHVNAEIFGQ
jgi:hypothetical protein